jgi:hypothetical protein
VTNPTSKDEVQNEGNYRTEGGRVCIDIRLRSIPQLFDGRDPAPFRERDLDEDAVAYIVESAEETPPRSPLKLVIWIADAERLLPDATVVEAIQTHFAYLLGRLRKELRTHVQQGQVKLVLGLVMLATFLTLSRLSAWFAEGTAQQVMQEGFSIVGWVAMWRPIEVLLYDWWPLLRQRRTLQRVADAEVEIKHQPNTSRSPSLG